MSSDKINATAEVFEALCDSLSVSSTFMACIHHQQMPGANVVRHPRSRQVIRHGEFTGGLCTLQSVEAHMGPQICGIR